MRGDGIVVQNANGAQGVGPIVVPTQHVTAGAHSRRAQAARAFLSRSMAGGVLITVVLDGELQSGSPPPPHRARSGTTFCLQAQCGAKTPKKRMSGCLGGAMSAARRARKCTGCMTRCVCLPQGFRMAYATRPSG